MGSTHGPQETAAASDSSRITHRYVGQPYVAFLSHTPASPRALRTLDPPPGALCPWLMFSTFQVLNMILPSFWRKVVLRQAIDRMQLSRPAKRHPARCEALAWTSTLSSPLRLTGKLLSLACESTSCSGSAAFPPNARAAVCQFGLRAGGRSIARLSKQRTLLLPLPPASDFHPPGVVLDSLWA